MTKLILAKHHINVFCAATWLSSVDLEADYYKDLNIKHALLVSSPAIKTLAANFALRGRCSPNRKFSHK